MPRCGPLPDDVVRAATVWTDGSADFTFVDGTVAAFGPRADTVVFLRPAGAADPNWDMHVRGGAATGSLDCPCAPKSTQAKDMYFTALSLTKDEAKLRGALEILSTLLPRPKLISGLLPAGVEERAWTSSVPIDSILVREVPAVGGAVLSLPSNVERLGNGGIRVWDEYRTTSLTIHPNSAIATVRWPAKVFDRDGVSTTFVSGADAAEEVSAESIDISARGCDRTANVSDISGTPSNAATAAALARARAPRVKATRFAMLSQHFPVSLLRSAAAASPSGPDGRSHDPQPRLDFAALHCWAVMLRIAETWRDASAALLPDGAAEGLTEEEESPDANVVSEGPEGGARVHCLQLPATLVPVDKTDSIARFPTLEAHHAASLVASANFLHSAACTAAAHPAPVAVAARFLHGEVALWATPDSGFTAVSGCLLRDLSHVSLAPRGCPRGEFPSALPQAFDSRHDAGPNASVWSATAAPSDAAATEASRARNGSASPARPAGEDEESPSSATPVVGGAGIKAPRQSAVPAVSFLYAADQSVPVPAPAGELRAERACGVHGGEHTRRAGDLRSVVSKSLGLACAIAASVSQCNHSRFRVGGGGGGAMAANGYGGGVANAIAESRRGLNTSVRATSGGAADGRGGIVRCGSYVPSVGKFTAFADGAIRVSFDDRTIITVIPAPGSVRTLANGGQLRDDSESHVDVVERSANRRAVRLAQIHPGHELFPYVQHAMAFAQFAELPDDTRQSLASSGGGADDSGGAGVHQSPPQYNAQLGHDQRRESAADLDAAIVRTRMLLKE